MRYLVENELGFDPSGLGFPSISGCHAIVYVTTAGLFALHNFGGADSGSWKDRSDALGVYVHAHVNGNAIGKTMYGVCYATGNNSRGYGVANEKQKWLGELAKFGDAVGYSGPIYGYDMSNQPTPPSAYVEFNKIGDKCVIQMKAWNPGDATKGINTSPADHQMMRRNKNGVGYALQDTAAQVVTAVTQAGLTTVYPEKLR